MEIHFKSLNEFYMYYLTEHIDATCRKMHFVGTTLVIILVLAAFSTGIWWLLAFTPLAGYGFAWSGHFFFEKNKPAAFKHPVYSLASDFIMYWHTITLQLPEKIEKAKKIYTKAI